MKDRTNRGVKPSSKRAIRRRNPIARSLKLRTSGAGAIPSPKRYTRKAKHPKRSDPE
jgi:hypothetical protein